MATMGPGLKDSAERLATFVTELSSGYQHILSDDDALFPILNCVMLGWALLVLLPRWRGTPVVTMGLVLLYSALYAGLLVKKLVTSTLPEGAGVASLEDVVALFSDRAVMFAGWTHYIAFDLFVARHMLLDSQFIGMPHRLVVWIFPITLMAGPAGLAAYACVKAFWEMKGFNYNPLLVVVSFVAVAFFADEALWPLLNVVMVGWISIICLPNWRLTSSISFGLAVFYSGMYAGLVLRILLTSGMPPGAGFGSLQEVVALFSSRRVIFAGWTHYIAFDLFVARFIVLDSQLAHMPHLSIVWTLPMTLMAGPAGLVAYAMTKQISRVVAELTRRGYCTGLAFLYFGTTALSLMMVCWVLIFPSSWLAGNSDIHDWAIEKFVDGNQVPLSIIQKYNGHKVIQFTHILPSALWAALIPVQLNPHMRKMYRKAHRMSGYVFFCTAASMMIGFVVLDMRRLDFERHDFKDMRSDDVDAHLSRIGLGWMDHILLGRCLMFWFVTTAVVALWRVIKKDFAGHQRWVFRHIASGLWVAVQRIYALTAPAPTRGWQKANFGDGISVGVFVTFLSAELAIWLLATNRAGSKGKTKAL